MIINVSIEEFKKRWYIADYCEDTYTDGTIYGIIIYEDNNYFVIKLSSKH